jgi:N-acetylglutamate synthase-like GNAT family acetyltransferase
MAMNNIRNILIGLLLMTAYITSAFSFYEYDDRHGSHISFRVIPSKETSGEEEQRLLVSTFMHMYKDYTPSDLKEDFETHDDVKTFLIEYFKKNWKHLEDPSNKLIYLEKAGKLIGVAIVEFMDEKDKATLHLRHLAIIPSEQGHGYGTAFMNSLKQYPGLQVNRIIADTHKLYVETRGFYRKTGFKEVDPHEDDLKGVNTKYIGLEWKKN